MLALLTPDQVRQLQEQQRRPILPGRLPKHLQWTIPIMDEITKEVIENIGKPREKRIDIVKIMDEVKKEMSAGKGE